jgi:hypothetical protein
MPGVDAQPVMAPVANHLISPGDLPLQDAVDEPVGVGLAASEDDFARVCGGGDDAVRAESGRSLRLKPRTTLRTKQSLGVRCHGSERRHPGIGNQLIAIRLLARLGERRSVIW